MAKMSHKPKVFAREVMEIIQKIEPNVQLEILQDNTVCVNGVHLDMKSLSKKVQADAEDASLIAEYTLKNVLPWEVIHGPSWGDVKDHIFPRLQQENIFDTLDRDKIPHIPFVNKLVVVFVIDSPETKLSVNTAQMQRWGKDVFELHKTALQNLSKCNDQKLDITESKQGGKAIVIANQADDVTPYLLIPDLHPQLSKAFGEASFYAALPSHNKVIFMTTGPSQFVAKTAGFVAEEFTKAQYPMTSELFLIVRDGVVGMGEHQPGLYSPNPEL